ncbi:Cyclin-dependent kinase G-2 [Neolecta irregularis DAH-3]|uniref:cyclin-dependent kinase n=1 Tax=Neolecta irregularis (strain DAH-3) TaxID=1198029 RepID=A0A1U7LVZ6_NEOID|nr:Cyclin-dependent kinase G-2 [Neolecta irregularis DAH-3]|eukprot:OLL26743.1 Cyclin-dependent kinase G-2 [Neolecta irregularis DAH-3]
MYNSKTLIVGKAKGTLRDSTSTYVVKPGLMTSRWDDNNLEGPSVASSRVSKKSRKRKSSVSKAAVEEQQPSIPSNRSIQFFGAPLESCRLVDTYEKLNHIEEGSYGIVYRARDMETGEIVALKKLKLDNEKNGFPVTSLREIETLMVARHPNIVNIREVVMGESLSHVFIVMDYIEHDLKTLMEDMKEPFLQSEVKTLMLQLLSATALLHDYWIIHRDLKTSNLLMNNRGMIKIADFGLARLYGDPLPPLTQLVVTLWYRAPELLLGAIKYDTAIDMWSIGCIFAELLTGKPLLQGKSELDQISKLLGVPSDEEWPGFSDLPNAKAINFPKHLAARGSILRARFPLLTRQGVNLLSDLLSLNPSNRITARVAMQHPYFTEEPRPQATELMPSFPSKSSGERRKHESPSAPIVDRGSLFGEGEIGGAGFSLRLH